jgi:hypothetical protein
MISGNLFAGRGAAAGGVQRLLPIVLAFCGE